MIDDDGRAQKYWGPRARVFHPTGRLLPPRAVLRVCIWQLHSQSHRYLRKSSHDPTTQKKIIAVPERTRNEDNARHDRQCQAHPPDIFVAVLFDVESQYPCHGELVHTIKCSQFLSAHCEYNIDPYSSRQTSNTYSAPHFDIYTIIITTTLSGASQRPTMIPTRVPYPSES